MQTLHLTLKKKWFDMILSGEKTEEYRDFKPYWHKRLSVHAKNGDWIKHKDFDVVIFKNGYSKNAPTMIVECKRIYVNTSSKLHWGAEWGVNYYKIELGAILSTENCSNNV